VPVRWLFSLTLFFSAALLFVVQPMVGKILLPMAGGTPGVWNTCMVFFQAALLAAYAYAHQTTMRRGPRKWAPVHVSLILLPLTALAVTTLLHGTPIHAYKSLAPQGQNYPFFTIIALLAALIGLPFFFLATTAPLVQRWFADTDDPAAKDPYFLYAASNLGSFVGLIIYPVLVERYLTLKQQGFLWAVGFVIWAGLIWLCANALKHAQTGITLPKIIPVETPITWWQRLRWVVLAAVPSSLMLSVTTYATTDLAPIPLFLIVPLGIYLLTFVFAFGVKAKWIFRASALLFPMLLLVIVFLRATGLESNLVTAFYNSKWLGDEKGQEIFWHVGYHVLVFTIVALGCHLELAHSRPSAHRLTEFYLWVSLGGVLGGLFNAFFAPIMFVEHTEYIVGLLAACYLVAPGGAMSEDRPAWRFALDVLIPVVLGLACFASLYYFDEAVKLWPLARLKEWLNEQEKLYWLERVKTILCFGVPALICFAFVERPLRFGLGVTALFLAAHFAKEPEDPPIFAGRSFFGTLSVTEYADENDIFHKLVHGTTVHGLQQMKPVNNDPLTYYHKSGPVGDIFRVTPAGQSKRPLGFVGLGTGSLTAYGQEGQHVTIFEIDPLVRRIAENPKYFSYLTNAKNRGVKLDIVMGDARLKLEDVPDGSLAVLAVDAFSSDSIPVHLLTKEAVELYFRKLAPDGVLALHVSNRYLALDKVVARIAEELHRPAFQWKDQDTGAVGKYRSDWIVMVNKVEDLGELTKLPKSDDDHSLRWEPLKVDPAKPAPLWTDDYSNVLSVFSLD
jgi:SAM-dependent methyltransferase